MAHARSTATMPPPAARIDITAEICPMTFVRTKLALEKLPPGALLEVRLRGEEPRRNVPRAVAEEGHAIETLDELADGIVVLRIRRR